MSVMSYDRDHLVKIGAEYAMKAYETNSAEGFHSNTTDATGFLWEQDGTQIVAFRGSDNWKDWLLNFSAVPVPWRKTMVHFGFYLHFASIGNKIIKKISNKKPLLIVGHSLGGANAEFLAYRMRQHPICDMVTFGKPNVFARVGAPKFDLSGSKISVVHGSDLVARIPRYFYRPSKQEMLYFGNDGSDLWNPTKKHRRGDWALGDSIKDHMMPDYVERVGRYLRNREGRV